jgi:general secretion pathway protein D
MVFLRPTIIRTREEAQGLAADRWGYIRDQQQAVQPDREPSLDALVRDYMRTQAPAAPATGEPMVIAPTGVTAPVAPVEAAPLPSAGY